jgi:hypothetical protein
LSAQAKVYAAVAEASIFVVHTEQRESSHTPKQAEFRRREAVGPPAFNPYFEWEGIMKRTQNLAYFAL